MTLANTSAKLLAVLAILLSMAAGGWAQANPEKKPAPKAAMKAKSASPAAKPKAPKAPKPKATAEATPAPSAGEAPAGDKIEAVGKRDPFAALINDKKDTGQHLPPGKAGLVIATVRVDGAVRSGNSMIAVVSNPEQSVYFIREGDRLYDGDVEKIGLDGVTFKENSKDAFGKPVERVVTKRIYASAGEQQ
jgi:Tfp pilus assembly protein PilP